MRTILGKLKDVHTKHYIPILCNVCAITVLLKGWAFFEKYVWFWIIIYILCDYKQYDLVSKQIKENRDCNNNTNACNCDRTDCKDSKCVCSL